MLLLNGYNYRCYEFESAWNDVELFHGLVISNHFIGQANNIFWAVGIKLYFRQIMHLKKTSQFNRYKCQIHWYCAQLTLFSSPEFDPSTDTSEIAMDKFGGVSKVTLLPVDCVVAFGCLSVVKGARFLCKFRFGCAAGYGFSYFLRSLYSAGSILRRFSLYFNASVRFPVMWRVMMKTQIYEWFEIWTFDYQILSAASL